MHEMVSEDRTEESLIETCDMVGKHLYLRKGLAIAQKISEGSLTEAEKDGMQVVFSMGGEGSRLRHITKDQYSKHLIDAGGKPISWYMMSLWAKAGFRNFTLLVDDTHRGDSIRDRYKDGKSIGVDVKYSIEHMKLSSGGALRYAMSQGLVTKSFINHFPDDMVVEYPEFASDLSRIAMRAFKLGYQCVIVCAPGKLYPYGVVKDEGGKVVDFEEKPFVSMDTSTGIFAMSKDAFPLVMELEPDKDVKMERTVLKQIARAGKMLKVIIPTEYWIPINDEPNLNKFLEIVNEKK